MEAGKNAIKEYEKLVNHSYLVLNPHPVSIFVATYLVSANIKW